jgi:hypothetical protein
MGMSLPYEIFGLSGASNMPVRWSSLRSKTDNSPITHETKWSEFVELFSERSVRAEKDGPAFAPASYPVGAKRANANVEAIHMIVLDFDSGGDPTVIVEEWRAKGYAFSAATTHQHTPEAPRWRAVFPLKSPIDPERWEAIWPRIAEHMAYGLSDQACKDPARLYFMPSCPPETSGEAWFDHAVGEAVDAFSLPAVTKDTPTKTTANGAATTDRPGDWFEANATWEEVLEPFGWRACGKSYDGGKMTLWTRPGKKSGVSARTGVGATGDRMYVWSSNANLPQGKALTKFSVRAHLEFGGDFSACGRAIVRQRGIAKERERRETPAPAQRLVDTLPTDGLPQIVVNDRELRDKTNDAIACLLAANDPPVVFASSGVMVWVASDEEAKRSIQIMSPRSLRHRLARVADWAQHTKKGNVEHVSPPMDVVDDLLASQSLPEEIPAIKGLTAVPILGDDGTVFATPGYDAISGWYLTDAGPWPVWEGDGPSAAAWLNEELFSDFPFADEASRANAMAMLLVTFARPLIDDVTPMHLVDAPTPGTGKGMLVKVALMPGLGRCPSATPIPEKDADLAKVLFSLLLKGSPAIWLDNLGRFLKSDALNCMLTTGEYEDRILGVSQMMTAKVRSAIAATSNNGRLSEDLARRTVWIRLDAKLEDPEKREGFRHADIEGWTAHNREKIAAAAIAMLQHWIREGRPATSARKGSFSKWCRVIGGTLECCGVKGFLENDKDFKALANDQRDTWAPFLALAYERYGSAPVLAKDLLRMAEECELLDSVFAKSTSERGRATAFGSATRTIIGKVIAGYSLERGPLSNGLARLVVHRHEGAVDSTYVAPLPSGLPITEQEEFEL